VNSTEVSISLRSTSGWCPLVASMRFCTAAATTTSLAPFERLMPSATTGSPLKRAKVRRSAMVSVNVPRSSSAPRRRRTAGSWSGEFVQRLGAGERPDRLVVLADLGPAAGKIDIGAAQALADIDGGQPRGLQSVRIKRDEDFALDTADALHLGDAAHALQRGF